MFLLWLALFLSTALPTLIVRVVSYDTGKPVLNAEVLIVMSDGRNVRRTTDDRGSIRIEITGSFRLEVRREGFRPARTSTSSLSGDAVYRVDIPIVPGDSNSAPEELDVQHQEVQDVQNRTDPTASEALPKADRLFGLRGGVNVSGIREGTGQEWLATTGNVFTNSSLATGVRSSVDFSAELGDSVAVDDALPAGEDAFHGNLHYFHRNDHFNAHNFFDLPDSAVPPFKYNFFGGDSGGRLREGTYLYTQYWGLRIGQSLTRAAIVPNPAWLRGDFSDVPDTLVDPQTGFVFTGNKIPPQRFDRTGLSLARQYPLPNVSDGSPQNYRAVAKLTTAVDSFGFRMDHRLSLSDETFAEYQFSRDTTDDPFNLLSGITNLPFFGVRDALRTHSLRLNNSHVFSATLIQQLRFSFQHLSQPRTILNSNPLPAVLMTGLSHIGDAANLPQSRRNRSFEVSNDLSLQDKNKTTRLGADFRYLPFHAFIDLYSRGQFQFTNGIFTGQSFANLLLGYPTNALRINGDSARDFRTWTWSFYVQHDWQPRPGLSLNGGVRYDYQSPYTEINLKAANFDPVAGKMAAPSNGLYNADRNNLAPRLGLVWRPPAKDIVVRAGYGIFYDTLAVGDSLFLLGLNPPFVRFDVEDNGPVAPLFSIDTAFQNSIESVHPSVFSASRDLRNPYVQQWSVSMERVLPWSVIVEAGYYGQKGTRLRRQMNLNQPSPGPIGTLDERRPYEDFRNIFQFETSASSIAHAADLRVSRRFGGRLGFAVGYRFSRMIDDATLISVLPQDSHNLRAERALADFHMKHRLSFEGTVNLPAPASPLRLRDVLRGWQAQTAGVIQSGTPLSAVLNADVAGTGYPIVNRPNLLRDPNISNTSVAQYFDTTAFGIPAAGQFGNSGRNVIIGPGLSNVDFALSRAFRVSDFTRMQFRADAYNLFNHPNFVAPPSMQNFLDTDGFGKLFVARSPRILQFGLKFLW